MREQNRLYDNKHLENSPIGLTLTVELQWGVNNGLGVIFPRNNSRGGERGDFLGGLNGQEKNHVMYTYFKKTLKFYINKSLFNIIITIIVIILLTEATGPLSY